MGDSGVLVRIVLREPVVWAVVVVLGSAIALLFLSTGFRAGWGRARRWAAVVAGFAIAVAPAVTLARPWSGPDPGRLRHCILASGDLVAAGPEALLNLVLLFPAALAAVLALHRPVVVAALLAALSLAVEGTQAVVGAGACEVVDVLRNAGGAAGGATFAWLLLRAPSALRQPGPLLRS